MMIAWIETTETDDAEGLLRDLYERVKTPQSPRTGTHQFGVAPHTVDVYNNLGLTLHYMGRSQEAVKR